MSLECFAKVWGPYISEWPHLAFGRPNLGRVILITAPSTRPRVLRMGVICFCVTKTRWINPRSRQKSVWWGKVVHFARSVKSQSMIELWAKSPIDFEVWPWWGSCLRKASKPQIYISRSVALLSNWWINSQPCQNPGLFKAISGPRWPSSWPCRPCFRPFTHSMGLVTN